MKTLPMLGLAAGLLAVPACGASAGPESDASKTPAQVEAEVKDVPSHELQSAIDAYEAATQAAGTELDDLQTRLEELAAQALDGALGEGKSDAIRAEIDQLEADLEKLKATVKDLAAKAKIYMNELASRG